MAPIRTMIGNPTINTCRYNEKYLLHLLRLKQRESKANLARETGMTAAAVGGIIKSLQEKGLVETVGKVQGDMGQPATLFSLSKDGAYGIGVSINRGHIETVLINFVGDVVVSHKHQLILPSPTKVQSIVLKNIDEMMSSFTESIRGRIAGIGVARPYNIGSWGEENSDWAEWDNFDLAAALSDQTGLPSVNQNDVNSAAIAEMIYGEANEFNDFIYVFFGSPQVQSFGGGLMLDGECRNGASGNAGDLGLIPVPPGNIPTSASQKGNQTTFLTNRCSLRSLVRYLRSEGLDVASTESFHKTVAVEPERVERWISDCVSGLEHAIYAIQAVVDVPELIIDCEDGDLALVSRIIDSLRATLASSEHSGLTMPAIRKGRFGSDASAIGAATLPLDSSFSPKGRGH